MFQTVKALHRWFEEDDVHFSYVLAKSWPDMLAILGISFLIAEAVIRLHAGQWI